MLINFKVHGVTKTQVPMKVKAGDESVTANVPAVEVELTTESEMSGSLTLRFYGKLMEEALATFVPDAEVAADFG